MKTSDLPAVFSILKKEMSRWKVPIVTQYADHKPDAFKILISTVISLRTKDDVTMRGTESLWKLAQTPFQMEKLSESAIAKAIYPAGFYKTKSKVIRDLSRRLVVEYNGRVPDEIDKLLQFKGVGRKTANLVVTKAYGKPGICVDTHVHRITNRWDFIRTKTPDETEQVLRQKLPLRYWLIINDILVTYGQNLCVPISPHCSECKISRFCAKRGVDRSR